jgi:hypothetical protein
MSFAKSRMDYYNMVAKNFRESSNKAARWFGAGAERLFVAA